MSQSTIDKAARLLATGNVEPETAPARVYTVHGDHGKYRVVIGAHIAICTCPANVRCSHIDAAVEYEYASPEARELIDACIERRKARDIEKADEIFDRLTA